MSGHLKKIIIIWNVKPILNKAILHERMGGGDMAYSYDCMIVLILKG